MAGAVSFAPVDHHGRAILPEVHESLIAGLASSLAAIPPRRRLVVAVSGGLDSLLLLTACAQYARRAGIAVHVLHVHHGLSSNADVWAQHVESASAALGVECRVLPVAVNREQASLEAAARDARHAALISALQPGDALLLGHHADDQAETVLLRLLRGSGVTGLAAMRPARELAGDAWLLRPWLGVSRARLHAEALSIGLDWIHDESNDERRHARNFLRHEAIPLLQSRWPALVATLAATASRLDEADHLLAGYLDTELNGLLHDSGEATSKGFARPALAVAPLMALPMTRHSALLRCWLQRCGAPVFQSHWLQEIRRIAVSRQDAEAELRVAGWEIHRYRGHLHAFPALPSPHGEFFWDMRGELTLGEGGGRLFVAEPHDPAGLVIPRPMPGQPVSVRFRRGGEKVCVRLGAGHRPLKKLLQEAGIPPWRRAHLPLLYVDDRLLAVADRFVDAEVAAALSGQPTLKVRWLSAE